MSSDTPKPRATNLPNIEPKVSAKIAVDAVLKVFTTFRDLTTEATLGDRRGIERVIVENYEAITAALEAVLQLAADVDVLEEVIILADEEAQGGKVAAQADAKAELDAKRSAAPPPRRGQPPPVDAHAGWRRPFRFMSTTGRVGHGDVLSAELDQQYADATQRRIWTDEEAARLAKAALRIEGNSPAAIAARRTADRIVASLREESEANGRLALDLAAVSKELERTQKQADAVPHRMVVGGTVVDFPGPVAS